ncbi:pyrolysin [Laccaria bicolor S238N-H82]|uniref:Pyrolysin n=1 Tax=Laccaria bicolor (strain S238N-H82 / ATCC MYA-4686) TaxID=486041 RepID=B0D1P7_LACBS|nr:pyrolysin [Laccaria bicolor S238N-H82]EDR11679.1 pyrolysin [Laccaria bicolor S238N-H82]|eukprot:XP_001877576.1 pyrolysin [Laccaria bicolor S238N-H82]
MKSASLWAVLPSLLASSAWATFPISSVKRESNLPVVPNKFIVEVDVLSNIPNKRSFTRSLDAVYDLLKSRDVSFQVDKEYDSPDLFVGAALTVTDAIALQNSPGIKAIRPVTTFQRPKPVSVHVVSGPYDPAIPPDSESTHILTGVDKLHAKGITGKGIKIGIIDTGIDYTHPLLGGNFGPGNKVIGGYDFVGDKYDGTNTPVPDNDPLDQCAGHGTHVAGIIGANPGNQFNISGVAYDSSLSAYRVFGCTGSVTDDIIVEALLRGVKDGQDILTLSLGGPDGWTESSSSVVASRIAASGKVVTIAAGNDGASGSWYSSSPGNGVDVISVSSVDNTVVPLQKLNVNGVPHDQIIYFATFPLPTPGDLPIYATSKDTTIVDDACEPLPDSTPDLSKFVVIVRRGTCSFVTKLTNVAAKGAKTTLIYDNGNGFAGISVGTFNAALIQAADGEFASYLHILVQQFAANAPITISFPQTGGSVNFPDPKGGLISSFTSYGPSNDFYFKPALAAPGGNILSTLPTTQGSFGVESGTSMATPFVAGSAALLFSVKGKSASVGKSARTLFETTAKRVPSSHTDGDPLQTVSQQGAGLINVFDAVYATTVVEPGELVLNDTAHFKGVQTFSVKNTGNASKKYKLTHFPAGTALTVNATTQFASLGPVPLTKTSASVTLVPNTFTLRPGSSQIVAAIFSPPKGLNAATYPLYSGFIEIAAPSENLHVTYIGLAASLKDKQVVDNSDIFFGEKIPALIDSKGDVQKSPTNYTFVGTDVPTLLWRLTFGTPSFRADLVDPNIKIATTLSSRGLFGSLPFFTFPHPQKGGSFAQVKVVGTLAELNYIPRNSENPSDNGYSSFALNSPTFANGTAIPSGSYRVLIRALRVTGNPAREEDYDSWLSPVLGVYPK